MNIRTKAISLLEKQITRNAQVLESRRWNAGTFYEIDLHFPNADLKWDKGVHHINCRVAPLTFREYTIAQWDADTRTCTLFIDASHNGQGTEWVKSLRRGDTIVYLNVECRNPQALPQQRCLCLGDQTTIGHFLALQQLIGNITDMQGAILVETDEQCREFKAYFPSLPLQVLPAEQGSVHTLLTWLQDCSANYDTVHLAGNTAMVVALRKELKAFGYHGRQIRSHTFWR